MNKKAFLISILTFISLIILQFVFSYLLYKLFPFKENLKLIVQISIDFSFIIIISGITYFWKLNLFDDVSIPNLKFVLISILLAVFLNIISPFFIPITFIENLKKGFISFNEPGNIKLYYTNLIGVYYDLRLILMMPILEELYFRRIIQRTLLEKYNPFFAILISSILFSLGHLDVEQSQNAFFVGIILGYLYLKTKNIIVPILFHSTYNILILFFQQKIIYLNETNYYLTLIYPLIILIMILILKLSAIQESTEN